MCHFDTDSIYQFPRLIPSKSTRRGGFHEQLTLDFRTQIAYTVVHVQRVVNSNSNSFKEKVNAYDSTQDSVE